jgi:hypothetical protein
MPKRWPAVNPALPADDLFIMLRFHHMEDKQQLKSHPQKPDLQIAHCSKGLEVSAFLLILCVHTTEPMEVGVGQEGRWKCGSEERDRERERERE